VKNLKIIDEKVIKEQGYLTRWLLGPWNSPCKLDFGIAFFQPGQKVDKHFHEQVEELFYVIDGQISIQFNTGSDSIILKAGEVAYIPPKEVHALYNNTNKVVKMVVIKNPSIPTDKKFLK